MIVEKEFIDSDFTGEMLQTIEMLKPHDKYLDIKISLNNQTSFITFFMSKERIDMYFHTADCKFYKLEMWGFICTAGSVPFEKAVSIVEKLVLDYATNMALLHKKIEKNFKKI